MFYLLSFLAYYRTTTVAIFLSSLILCSTSHVLHADTEKATSKRIEVYSLSQNYWDTQYGETLGEIVLHLLPNNPSKREDLKQDIIRLNPQAFINSDPAQLLADKRLWMPGYMKQADTRVDPSTTTVENYSWGNIKRPKK